MSTKIDKLDVVRQALAQGDKYSKENSTMATESIECNVDTDSKTKVSTVRYSGPDGKFTIKYNPGKGQATADVDFVTGRFRSTVTSDSCKTKGQDPVYHPFWGVFRNAFNQQ